LPHTRQHGCIDILHCCNDTCLQVGEVTWQWWDVLCTASVIIFIMVYKIELSV
jgi:hypothetical protein